MKEKLKLYQGYFVIFILSLISIFFLPMLGSTVGLGFSLPTTAAGWVVWLVSKLAVIIINMLLFDQFVKQAKINIKDNPQYLEACRIFNTLNPEGEEEILEPAAFLSKLYRTKGTKVMLTSALSVVALSNAILTFNWVTMLTYLFTVVMGIIYGFITMATVEEYWVEDYYKLAIRKQNKHLKSEETINVTQITERDSSSQS